MRAGGTRRLVALFVAGTLLPSGALVWLGARLIEQDRQLERQRVQDFVESAANRVTGSLERQLGTIERNLGSAAADDPATPPAGLKVRIFVDGHADPAGAAACL